MGSCKPELSCEREQQRQAQALGGTRKKRGRDLQPTSRTVWLKAMPAPPRAWHTYRPASSSRTACSRSTARCLPAGNAATACSPAPRPPRQPLHPSGQGNPTSDTSLLGAGGTPVQGRGLLPKCIPVSPLYHVMWGGGVPETQHSRVTSSPTSTFRLGVTARMAGGSAPWGE